MESALDGLAEHRFAARGRQTARLAAGPEIDILQAVFARSVRWVSRSGEGPAVVEVTHERLLKLLPRLLDPQLAAAVGTTKRLSDLAHVWRSALEDGVELLAGRAGQPPEYRVRLWVRNANATCKFWFDVESNEGSVVRTPRYGHTVSLERVLAETEEPPPYRAMWRRILDAAKRGDLTAQEVVRSARIGAALLVLTIALTLATSEPAQAAVRRFIERAWNAIQRTIHGESAPAGSRIDVRPTPDQRVEAMSITEVRELPAISTGLRLPNGAEVILPASTEAADIYVYGFVRDEQEVTVLVTPSPALNGIVGFVEVDFGDGTKTTRENFSPLSDSLRSNTCASLTHKYAQGAKTYTIAANVFEERGAKARLVETIRRRVYIFPRTKAEDPIVYHAPYHPHPWDARMSVRSDLEQAPPPGHTMGPSIVVDLPAEELP